MTDSASPAEEDRQECPECGARCFIDAHYARPSEDRLREALTAFMHDLEAADWNAGEWDIVLERHLASTDTAEERP